MLSPNYLFAYVVLAIAVTTLVVRLTRRPIAKWIAAILSITTFWLFGHIDDFLGAREHRALCAKEAGVKVYKKANLPQEFYNADGTPNFMRPEGPDRNRLRGYIEFRPSNTSNYSRKFLRIDKWVDQVVDVRTGEILAEHIEFAAWPSPFIPSFGHSSAKACPPDSPSEKDNMWWEMHRRVFNLEHGSNAR
jgi:hypothetical protein